MGEQETKTFLIKRKYETKREIEMIHPRYLDEKGENVICVFSALSTAGYFYIGECPKRKCHIVVVKNDRTQKFNLYVQVKENPLEYMNWKLDNTVFVEEVHYEQEVNSDD